MAPGLAVSGVFDLLGIIGLGGGEVTVTMDLALRAAGLVLFALLLVENRRGRTATEDATGAAEPA